MEKQKKSENDEKREKKHELIYRKKSYVTAGVVTLVAVVAMVGAYQHERKSAQKEQNETVALAENDWIEPKTDTDTTSAEDETQETLAAQTPKPQTSDNLTTQNDASAASQTDPVQGNTDTGAVADQIQSSEEPVMHFAASDTISWPLEGDVILNYSMDHSIYFATLDQYKYNPAVIIAGHVNDKVTAAADGQVIGVDTTAETGQTVTIGLGDSYQAIYGQLKELEVSAGDYVSQGDTIGYLAEPTKYYSVEGPNLYFAITKSGNPINPLDYIR